MKSYGEQIANPRYHYLQLERGVFFRHGKRDPQFQGKIRLSFMAGQEMLKWARSIGYKSAILVPVESQEFIDLLSLRH